MDKLSLVNDLLKGQPSGGTNCGGFWNAPVAKINKETKELLEVLLQESRLTLSQKQQIRASIKSGNRHLPLNLSKNSSCKSTSSRTSSSSNPFKENKGLRPRQSIISSGCNERARFRSQHIQCKDGRVEKERLQNLMTYGQELSPDQVNDTEIHSHQVNETVKLTEETIAQLQREIEERLKFLEDTKKLRGEKQFKPIILTEISQRKRQIAILANSK